MTQNQTPDQAPTSGAGSSAGPAAAPKAPPEPSVLLADETIYYEGGPARGDLILSLLFGLTIIGLPIAVGAVVRALWLRFRITSRRISVSGGWLGRERTQVVYSQIREVLSVPRGLGAWGDMVLVLNDGSRLEMRAVPRFRELEAYIEERRQQRTGPARTGGSASTGFGDTTRATA